MSECIPIKNGHVCLVQTGFNCPKCRHAHSEMDWYPKMEEEKSVVVYINCNNCNEEIGVTTDIKGDVQVWLKSNEND